jgi:phosphoribosylaminoimidazolecarboxamide formyltransferase/IMP cyclohydrolase
LNRRIDRALAEALVDQFVELLFAPGYDDDALEVLAS